MNDEQAWALEKRFWLEGSSVYDDLLDPECIMAFPGIGIIRASDVLASLKGTPRRTSVEMTDRAVGRTGPATLVLGYRAEGRRSGAAAYHAFCTSTYRRDGDMWKLVQHEQTLVA